MSLASQPAMEALTFRRLWRPITSVSSENRHDIGGKEPREDEEDSFFELELTAPVFNPKIYSPPITNTKGATSNLENKPDMPTFVCSEPVLRRPSSEKTEVVHKYNFSQSKRKILPVESSFPRPQSTISLLKSAPKFRVFMFRKSKSVSAEEAGRNRGRNFFTLRFKLKEIEPALMRDRSLRKNENASCSDCPLHGMSNMRRSSKEVIQKYLMLVKPLYVKVSKRQTGGVRFAREFSKTATAPSSSANRTPHSKAPGRFNVEACRQLGKSKSASTSVTGIVSPARRDDSLLQQHDGIESAILHCKRSFSSSRGLND